MGLTQKFKHTVSPSKMGGWVGGACQEIQTPCLLQQGGCWDSPRSSSTLSTVARWVGRWGSPRSSNTLCTAVSWMGGWCSPRSSNTLSSAVKWVVGGWWGSPRQGGWVVGLTNKSNTLSTATRWVGGWGSPRSSNTLSTGLTKKFKHPVYCSKVGGWWGSPRSSNTLSTAARWLGGDHQEVQTHCLLQQGGWRVVLIKKFKHPIYCSKVGGWWLGLAKKFQHPVYCSKVGA